MATTQNLSTFTINNIDSKETFDYMVQNNLVSDNELYLVAGAADDYLPEGGTEGQILTKTSDTKTPYAWKDIGKCFHVGTSAPTNTNLLWIDTSSGLKYYNGSAWVVCPVAWS